MIFLLFSFFLALAGCNKNEEKFGLGNPPQTITRAFDTDSVEKTSTLLLDLKSYNDSLLASYPDNPHTRMGERFMSVSLADAIGYVVGFWKGKRDGIDIANIIGTMTAAIASKTQYKIFLQAISPDPNYQYLPSTTDVKRYELSYSAVINCQSYQENYEDQLKSLGDLSSFNDYLPAFKVGIEHNLTLDKYTTVIDDVVTDLFSPSFINEFYSQESQANFLRIIDQIVSNEINYNALFSDYTSLTQTPSQYKASVVFKQYLDCYAPFDGTGNVLKIAKSIALNYLNKISQSSELDDIDRQVLMSAIPIVLTSHSYWHPKFAKR